MNDPSVPAVISRRPRGRPPKDRTNEPNKPLTKRQKLPFKLYLPALPGRPEAAKGISVLQPGDMSLDLAGVRIELTSEQEAIAREQMGELAKHEVTGYAFNSRRSIRSDWYTWLAFTKWADCTAMPIAFDDLRDYLDCLVKTGYKKATLEHHLFALKMASRLYACPDPMGTLVAKAYWRDICRDTLIARQKQAKGLNNDDLTEMLSGLDSGKPRDIRDAAMVSMAYDMLARPSEVVGLRWEDTDLEGDDGTCLVARSKTDQTGEGTELYLTPRSTALLKAWLAICADPHGPIFHAIPPKFDGVGDDARVKGLNVREVTRIYARVAKVGNISGKRLSGHSVRVGGAQDLTLAGATVAEIMQAGRWESQRMPKRYAENIDARKAGRERHAKLEALAKKRDVPSVE